MRDTLHMGYIKTMFDMYLGPNYDIEKFTRVKHLQITKERTHIQLMKQLEDKQITPNTYVDSVNALFKQTFQKCKEVLGDEDFMKLFGTDSCECAVLDKEGFLDSYK